MPLCNQDTGHEQAIIRCSLNSKLPNDENERQLQYKSRDFNQTEWVCSCCKSASSARVLHQLIYYPGLS